MATISFPVNPTLYQTTTTGGQTWAWNGEAWVSAGSLSAYYYTLPDASTTTLGGIKLGTGLSWIYSSPWTGTIAGITSTSTLLVGDVITATNGTGSLGSGGLYVVESILSVTSIKFTATGGTTPVAGTITSLIDSGTNLGSGTISNISGTGTVQASGIQGPTGPAGGYTGTTGPQGIQGPTGLSGTNGGVGATGAGFSPISSTSSIAIGTGNKTFVVNTLDADTNFDIGSYIRVYNSNAAYMEGAITSYTNYNLIVNVDTAIGTGTISSWTIILAGSKGNPGATGATGATGASGLQGSSGATGATGIQGFIGATGASGLQGSSGATGATGIQGFIGATGASGLQGSSGATGASGIQGFIGATGASGIQGFIGTTGATGASGIQGFIGTTGATGASGIGFSPLTSTTSIVIGVGTITIQVNKDAASTSHIPGQYMRIFYTSNPSIFLEGYITAYSSFQLSINVTFVSGTGTYTNWGLVFSAFPGATGIGATGIGASGATGYQGSTGAGATGASGATGYQGATGQGIQGNDGSTGLSGNVTKTYYYGGTLIQQVGSLRFYLANPATLTKIVSILQTPGSSQTTLLIKQNGGTISTINIPSATTVVTTNLSQILLANDYLTVDISVAGNNAAYLYVTFIYG